MPATSPNSTFLLTSTAKGTLPSMYCLMRLQIVFLREFGFAFWTCEILLAHMDHLAVSFEEPRPRERALANVTLMSHESEQVKMMVQENTTAMLANSNRLMQSNDGQRSEVSMSRSFVLTCKSVLALLRRLTPLGSPLQYVTAVDSLLNLLLRRSSFTEPLRHYGRRGG